MHIISDKKTTEADNGKGENVTKYEMGRLYNPTLVT